MPDVNPNPHEFGYVFVPLNRITALFDATEDARNAVQALKALGFGPGTLDVFVGVEGAAALDLSGEAHGVATRAIRNFEAFMVQVAGDSHKQMDTALKAGGVAVAVLMDGKEDRKDDVAALLRDHRAGTVRYWSRWTIEALD